MRHLEMVSVRAFEMPLDSSLTHASIATSFRRSGFDVSPDSRLAWNLGPSFLLRSGQSGGLRKDGYVMRAQCGARHQINWEDQILHDGDV